MPRNAVKDGFAYEKVSEDAEGKPVEVRRVIKAGSVVPDEYRVEDKSILEDYEPGKDPLSYRDYQRATTTREQVVSTQAKNLEADEEPLTVTRKDNPAREERERTVGPSDASAVYEPEHDGEDEGMDKNDHPRAAQRRTHTPRKGRS